MARSAERVAPLVLRCLPWLVVSAFVVIQAGIIRFAAPGPSLDEGIYTTVGLRTLEGYGLSDRFLTWIPGSLSWPLLAAAGWKLDGLQGARLAALFCITIALIAVVRATANLFGRQAQLWTAIVAVSLGPVIALGHTAVYDVLAIAGVAVALVSITELNRTDNRFWLVGASLAFVVGISAKYPALPFAVVPFCGLVLLLRRRKAAIDLSIATFVIAGCSLAYVLPLRTQFQEFAEFWCDRVAQGTPDFQASDRAIIYSLVYYGGVPLTLGIGGVICARGRRAVAGVLLSGSFTWPLYHFATSSPVGDHKHAALGAIFLLPLIGVALASIAQERRIVAVPLLGLVILGLGLFGVRQSMYIDRASPDLRQPIQYLEARVRPGDHLLINNAWPYVLYLYESNRVQSPWDVYDPYRIANAARPIPYCSFNWFVQSAGWPPWPENVVDRVTACPGMRRVRAETAEELVGIKSEGGLATYIAASSIWKNDRPTPEANFDIGVRKRQC